MTTKVWIDPEFAKNLIGFEIQVFIAELSAFKSVCMSPAEAMEYCSKAFPRDIMAVWLNSEGEIVKTFANVLKSSKDNLPAISVGCYSRTAVVCVDGYCGRKAGDRDGWYNAIGQQCYPMRADGQNDNDKPSFCYFEGRKQQLLNKGGFDTIRRSATELCGKARDKRYGQPMAV